MVKRFLFCIQICFERSMVMKANTSNMPKNAPIKIKPTTPILLQGMSTHDHKTIITPGIDDCGQNCVKTNRTRRCQFGRKNGLRDDIGNRRKNSCFETQLLKQLVQQKNDARLSIGSSYSHHLYSLIRITIIP